MLFFLPSSSGKLPCQVILGGTSSGSYQSTSFTLSVQLSSTHTCKALLDRGAAGNLILAELVSRLHVSLEELTHPVLASSVDVRPLQCSPILHCTASMHMVTGDHQETIHFLVKVFHTTPLILGLPWFMRHSWIHSPFGPSPKPKGGSSGSSTHHRTPQGHPLTET